MKSSQPTHEISASPLPLRQAGPNRSSKNRYEEFAKQSLSAQKNELRALESSSLITAAAAAVTSARKLAQSAQANSAASSGSTSTTVSSTSTKSSSLKPATTHHRKTSSINNISEAGATTSAQPTKTTHLTPKSAAAATPSGTDNTSTATGTTRKSPAAAASAAFKRKSQTIPQPPQVVVQNEQETSPESSTAAVAGPTAAATVAKKRAMEKQPIKPAVAAVSAASSNAAKAKAAAAGAVKEAKAKAALETEKKEAKARAERLEAAKEAKAQAAALEAQREAKIKASLEQTQKNGKNRALAKKAVNMAQQKLAEIKVAEQAKAAKEAKKLEAKLIKDAELKLQKEKEKAEASKAASEAKPQSIVKRPKSKEAKTTPTPAQSSLTVPASVSRSLSPGRRAPSPVVHTGVLSPVPMRSGALSTIPLLQHHRSTSDAPLISKAAVVVGRRNSASPKRTTPTRNSPVVTAASSRLAVPRPTQGRSLSADSLNSSGSECVYSSNESGTDGKAATRTRKHLKKASTSASSHYQSSVPSQLNGAHVYHPPVPQGHSGLSRMTLRDKRSKTAIGFINPFNEHQQPSSSTLHTPTNPTHQARRSIDLPPNSAPKNVPLSAAKLASTSGPMTDKASPPVYYNEPHRGLFGRFKKKLKSGMNKDGTPAQEESSGVAIKTTMRTQQRKRSFNEDKPWKHHVDAVKLTDSERKRYEGMWAANRGSHIPYLFPEEVDDSEDEEDEEDDEDEDEHEMDEEFESDADDDTEYGDGESDLDSIADDELLRSGTDSDQKSSVPGSSGESKASTALDVSDQSTIDGSKTAAIPSAATTIAAPRPSLEAKHTSSSTAVMAATAARGLIDENDPMQSIHGFVVRDLWRRSRLSEDTLSRIWDLVDRRHDGCLDREGFLVGMWLVDQCLYGRKLPPKIDDTLWSSVGRLNVRIKIRRRKEELKAERQNMKKQKKAAAKSKKSKSKSKRKEKHHKHHSHHQHHGQPSNEEAIVLTPDQMAQYSSHQHHLHGIMHVSTPISATGSGLSKIGGIVGIGKKKTKMLPPQPSASAPVQTSPKPSGTPVESQRPQQPQTQQQITPVLQVEPPTTTGSTSPAPSTTTQSVPARSATPSTPILVTPSSPVPIASSSASPTRPSSALPVLPPTKTPTPTRELAADSAAPEPKSSEKAKSPVLSEPQPQA